MTFKELMEDKELMELFEQTDEERALHKSLFESDAPHMQVKQSFAESVEILSSGN